jgi:hypothetical protein
MYKKKQWLQFVYFSTGTEKNCCPVEISIYCDNARQIAADART